MKKLKKEGVYKGQVTHLLLSILTLGAEGIEDSNKFDDLYRRKLKFQKVTDWKRYRASVDLLDDTESAIMSAFEYQLGDLSNRNRDIGETNLRLYGILNAVYLQMNAFEQIGKLLQFPNANEISKQFRELDIYKLRGIAGSHTVDYLYDKQSLLSKPGVYRTTSFRIVQMYLEKTGKEITVLDENNITFKFNLLKILTEYERIATDLLIKLILHMIKTLIFDKETKTELKQRLTTMLPNLVDYTTMDKNKEYKIQEKKRLQKYLREIKGKA